MKEVASPRFSAQQPLLVRSISSPRPLVMTQNDYLLALFSGAHETSPTTVTACISHPTQPMDTAGTSPEMYPMNLSSQTVALPRLPLWYHRHGPPGIQRA